MTVHIRVATERDLPAIPRLYGQPEIDAGQTPAIEDTTGIFKRRMTYPGYALYVAVTGQAVGGLSAASVVDLTRPNGGHVTSPQSHAGCRFLRR